VSAGLACTGRRLDEHAKRRWRYLYGTGGSATAGTSRGIPVRTRILGSKPATEAGQAVAHRQACRPDRARRRKYSQPAWWHQRCCAATSEISARHNLGISIASFLPDPNQQPSERGRSPAGKYIAHKGRLQGGRCICIARSISTARSSTYWCRASGIWRCPSVPECGFSGHLGDRM
jgi:hypothetical protein